MTYNLRSTDEVLNGEIEVIIHDKYTTYILSSTYHWYY